MRRSSGGACSFALSSFLGLLIVSSECQDGGRRATSGSAVAKNVYCPWPAREIALIVARSGAAPLEVQKEDSGWNRSASLFRRSVFAGHLRHFCSKPPSPCRRVVRKGDEGLSDSRRTENKLLRDQARKVCQKLLTGGRARHYKTCRHLRSDRGETSLFASWSPILPSA